MGDQRRHHENEVPHYHEQTMMVLAVKALMLLGVLSLFALGLGAGALGTFYSATNGAYSAQVVGKVTEGKLIETDAPSFGNVKDYLCTATISYVVDDRVYQMAHRDSGRGSTPPRGLDCFSTGQTVALDYKPENPGKSRFHKDGGAQLGTAVTLLVFTEFFLFLIVKILRVYGSPFRWLDHPGHFCDQAMELHKKANKKQRRHMEIHEEKKRKPRGHMEI